VISMDRTIKVIQYGPGPIGCQSVRYLMERGYFELVGAIDSDPQKVGVEVGELVELNEPLGLSITADSAMLLKVKDAELLKPVEVLNI